MLLQWLALLVRGLALVNLAIIVVGLVPAASLAKENRRLTAEAESKAA